MEPPPWVRPVRTESTPGHTLALHHTTVGGGAREDGRGGRGEVGAGRRGSQLISPMAALNMLAM